jgi:putative transposase
MNKPGYDVGKTTVSTVLNRHRVLPAPERGRQGSNWQAFLNHYKDQFLACDFFTVETLWLQTRTIQELIERDFREEIGLENLTDPARAIGLQGFCV